MSFFRNNLFVIGRTIVNNKQAWAIVIMYSLLSYLIIVLAYKLTTENYSVYNLFLAVAE